MRKLITYLLSFFTRGKPLATVADPLDIYKPRERRIYYYFDGAKQVAADPMVLYKRLMSKEPDLSFDMKLATSESKDATKGHNNAVAKLRDVFSVKPLEEGGLTELEAIDLFDHFMEWSGMVKKNSSPSATSPTATLGSTGSSLEGSPPSPNSLGSGSTASEPSTEEPVPSQSDR